VTGNSFPIGKIEMIKNNNDGQSIAFVIMPFASEFSTIYTELIKPALEDAGYTVTRADSDLHQENILRKIVNGISTASLVVAEITTLNPNVLYELGLAHGLGVPTVLLAQSMKEVPFDLRAYNIQLYSTHFSEVTKLRAALKAIGEGHLKGQIVFANPVTDFAPTRIPIGSEPHRVGTLSNEKEFPEVGDKGIIDATVASQEFAKIAGVIVTEINSSVGKVSPLLTQFDEASQDPSPGNSRKAQRIADRIAAELDKSTLRIAKYLPEIEDNIRIPFQVWLRYITLLDPEDQRSREQLNNFRGMFEELSEKMPLVLKGLRSYVNSVAMIGLRSAALGPPSLRHSEVAEKITTAMEQIQASISRAIQVIDERLRGIESRGKDDRGAARE
jgi:hypothetical protein